MFVNLLVNIFIIIKIRIYSKNFYTNAKRNNNSIFNLYILLNIFLCILIYFYIINNIMMKLIKSKLINHTKLINKINNLLKKYYPIKKSFKNINELSHFRIEDMTLNEYFPFEFDINGIILSGKYKSYKIVKVKTINWYSWKRYILLYLSYYTILRNPFVDKSNLVINELHKKNKIDILSINDLIIQKDNDILEIDANYQNKNYKNNIIKNIKSIDKDNHFYFSSFVIDENTEEIRRELMRLFINRDKYNSIHIHLNEGGDSSPGNLIVRCLVGQLEPWMKKCKKIDAYGIHKWNLWNEDKKGVINFRRIEKLKLDFTVNYFTKYKGKIHLYIDGVNSAAWYLTTYLIYAFSSEIKRFHRKYYGQIIKFGTISKDSQLVLHGQSSTCSGDGNWIPTKYHDIIINIPTMQRLENEPIKKIDFNRFWIGD